MYRFSNLLYVIKTYMDIRTWILHLLRKARHALSIFSTKCDSCSCIYTYINIRIQITND